jgi:hypothetical protein
MVITAKWKPNINAGSRRLADTLIAVINKMIPYNPISTANTQTANV